MKELITQRIQIKLAIRTESKYLSLWSFAPKKPLKKAYEESLKNITQLLDEVYPETKSLAGEDKAAIYCGVETDMRNDIQREQDYVSKGKTPVVRRYAEGAFTNKLSAIPNQGNVRFKVFGGGMNTDILIDFVKRLIKDACRIFFLILENLWVNHAKTIEEWLEDTSERIEVFYLPAYSPELNPDEYLNCDPKPGVGNGKHVRSKDQVEKKVSVHMRMLKKKPARAKHVYLTSSNSVFRIVWPIITPG